MENVLTHILVVNINGLKYTRDLVSDLMRQTSPFHLTLVDQGSDEKGTQEFLDSLISVPYPNVHFNIVRNQSNIPLNHLWNGLHQHSSCEYLCFLNNDVRIPSNFVSDIEEIFRREKEVGMIAHATNHPEYQQTTPLRYSILETRVAQGWDFAMRKQAYIPIPEDIPFFGGDDWLFVKAYRKGWKLAIALSSPIIHYKAQSRKYYTGNRLEEDALVRSKYKIERISYRSPYTKQSPKFDKIREE